MQVSITMVIRKNDDKADAELLRAIVEREYRLPKEKTEALISGARAYVDKNLADPLTFVKDAYKQPNMQVLVLGEAHELQGRTFEREMLEAAADSGAKVLYLEVHKSDQPLLDKFMRSGNPDDLPIYIKSLNEEGNGVLEAARKKGMRFVAVDGEYKEYPEEVPGQPTPPIPKEETAEWRNHIMVDNIIADKKTHPGEKGIMIVGQSHLTHDPNAKIDHDYHNIKDLFEKQFPGGMITVGRAIDDDVVSSALAALFNGKNGIVPAAGLPLNIPEYLPIEIPGHRELKSRSHSHSYDAIMHYQVPAPPSENPNSSLPKLPPVKPQSTQR